MALLLALLYRSHEIEAGYVRFALMLALKQSGADPRLFAFHPIRCDGAPDFIVTSKLDGRLVLHPYMRKPRPSRRPDLPGVWTTHAAWTCGMQSRRRNARSSRTFLHAAPIAPAIRAPRVVIPPW